MTREFWPSVINDYERLLESEEGQDTIIYVGENQHAIRAHSLILRIRSQYFQTAFSRRWAERRNGMLVLRKPNIELQIFKIILKFIYCGNVELTNLQGPEILRLIMGSEELNVQPLSSYAKKFMNEKKLKFLEINPIEIIKIIHENSLFTDLWDDYLEIICNTPEILFSSEEFPSLDESLLMILLKCKAYKIDESKIWESVLKWGLSKHSSFSGQEITDLSKEQLKMLKLTLEDIIPLIKFEYFDSTDVYQKVLPYKKLLSKELVNELLKKFLDRSSCMRCCHRTRYHKLGASNIITPQHYNVFANWIDKESDYKLHNNPYTFKLLFSHNIDDDKMNLPIFHSLCSRIKTTLIVAKIKNSDKVIGGYNPIGFNSQNSYRSTRNSFIFFFKDKDDIKTGKCGYVSRPEKAIYCNEDLEPAFGMGPDLLCKENGTWTSNPSSYPSIGIPRSFEISHYEVFHIIKNETND
ncbi:hypothetical protein C1645_813953 [Glomus cerebriforme]|uniref:BTB domain-containing protein n=1 Tax=Glomus cerebriforme TaxID=658196 RepID=A0A397THP8_9GLOM|nr:hypothetical protein C1645_813953 [Glomus cerebriforme]